MEIGLPPRKLNEESFTAAWVKWCSGFPEWEILWQILRNFLSAATLGLLAAALLLARMMLTAVVALAAAPPSSDAVPREKGRCCPPARTSLRARLSCLHLRQAPINRKMIVKALLQRADFFSPEICLP
jgi:hypothetical protein